MSSPSSFDALITVSMNHLMKQAMSHPLRLVFYFCILPHSYCHFITTLPSFSYYFLLLRISAINLPSNDAQRQFSALIT